MAKSGRTLALPLLLLGFAFPGVADVSPTSDPQIPQPAPLAEVSARGGKLAFSESDVVLLIDRSSLVLLASGVDVNGNGVVGRNREKARVIDGIETSGRFWTNDQGDTIERLQLQVARALIPRLAARRNRVGLLSYTLRAWSHGTSVVQYTERPEVRVPVGEPAAVLAALEDFPAAQERRRTDLMQLLERGATLLDEATSVSGPPRPRAILLLSPGRPSAPDGIGWSSRRAVAYAGELAERDIELWVIPLGDADREFFDELTHSVRGDVLLLEQLDAVFGAPTTGDAQQGANENRTKSPESSSASAIPQR